MLNAYRWETYNLEKIDKHGLSAEEVEWVVDRARRPYPKPIGDERWLVVGATNSGEVIQVYFLLDDDGETIFVYHARPRTERERNRDRRRRRKRP